MHLGPKMEAEIRSLLAEQTESELDAHEIAIQHGLGRQDAGAAIIAEQQRVADEIKAIAGDAAFDEIVRADEIAPSKALILTGLGLMLPGENAPYSPEQLDALAEVYYNSRRNSGGAAPWDTAAAGSDLNPFYRQIAQGWQAIVGPAAMAPLLKILSSQQSQMQALRGQFGR
jgi:hypothetical protein